MIPENENAYTPANEDTRSVHPFTEDEPTVPDPVESDRITEDLAPEDEPDTDAPNEEPYTRVPGGQRVSVTELGPLFGGTQASEFQQRWQDIQSGFVEDPASAVRRAEDLTDKIVTSLTQALAERRQTLGQSAQNGDTEQLRLVLRQYRDVLESVTSL